MCLSVVTFKLTRYYNLNGTTERHIARYYNLNVTTERHITRYYNLNVTTERHITRYYNLNDLVMCLSVVTFKL
jgi:hypothetical protein